MNRSLSGVLTRINTIAIQVTQQAETLSDQELIEFLNEGRRRAFQTPEPERPSHDDAVAMGRRLRRLLRGEVVYEAGNDAARAV